MRMAPEAARAGVKVFRCEKSQRDVALVEPRCLNPKAYCKWRTACPVHVLEREQRRRER